MNKIILVTGASSGFGLEIFNYLNSKGIHAYGVSRTLKDSIQDRTFTLDVTDFDKAKEVVKQIVQIEGHIDALVNVAGFGISGAVEDTPIEAIKRQIEVNFIGAVNLVKAVLPYMREKHSGLIINFSSIAGLIGLPYQAFYSSSKFAIEGFSQALRMEVEQFGIHVVVVEPGDFKTGFTGRREKYTKENSPYYEKFFKAISRMEKDETEGSDPKIVAELIYKIITSKNPQNKYVVGPFFEKLFVILKKILPESLIQTIFKMYYGL
ncbi:SDR family oxidoreductase [Caldisericum exile]|uniref:Oxidoreductase n=1 Tax=Caldisericum exile (strain DSM 21853 / NBRC 104410 / AZM16c01) TaxID=511051 RepID=A0A7U6JH69_CALEA|nr:SDR family oxidoreductase [Caldisericum exile]BAL81562.1 oxidoreductase [Caldisericum exile AZM16c01]